MRGLSLGCGSLLSLSLLPLLACAAGCADTAIGTLGGPELTPKVSPTAAPPTAQVSYHAHSDSTIELPEDVKVIEPSQPATATPQQKALVHVHAGGAVCSGVVVDPRLVVTAHQCVAPEGRGVVPAEGVRVEISSSTLSWTERAVRDVIVPDCAWQKLDMAVLVLAEPVAWVAEWPASSAPGPGGTVDALGFGNCSADPKPARQRNAAVLDSERDAFVMDLGMCKGDVGGPVFDVASGGVVGIVSHQDDPDGSPRHTTTATRLDAPVSRDLYAQALAFAKDGKRPTSALSCK
jgi:hypothetical protein